MVVLELRQLRGGGARRDGGGQKGGDAPEVPGPVYVVQAERGSEVAGWMMALRCVGDLALCKIGYRWRGRSPWALLQRRGDLPCLEDELIGDEAEHWVVHGIVLHVKREALQPSGGAAESWGPQGAAGESCPVWARAKKQGAQALKQAPQARSPRLVLLDDGAHRGEPSQAAHLSQRQRQVAEPFQQATPEPGSSRAAARPALPARRLGGVRRPPRSQPRALCQPRSTASPPRLLVGSRRHVRGPMCVGAAAQAARQLQPRSRAEVAAHRGAHKAGGRGNDAGRWCGRLGVVERPKKHRHRLLGQKAQLRASPKARKVCW